MTLPFAKRTVLVAALLVGQLVCLLAGVAWFGHWLEQGLSQIVRERVLAGSRQIAGQFGRTVDLLNIQALPLSRQDWDRLQTMVEETRLPNGGQLAIIDSDTGQVLAHPDLRDNPKAASLPFAEALLSESVDPEADEGWKRMPDGTYVLAASSLPQINAYMLVLQPESPLRELVASFVGRVRVIGLMVVVVLIAFSGALSYLIMHTYEDRMTAENKGLEALVARRSRALMHSREGAIFGLAKLAESRDGETGEHLDRISTYTELLARQIAARDPDLDDAWIHSLTVASSLHDIGKVGIPDAVLLKPGALTDEERQIIEKHPYIGGETLIEIQRRWGDDPFLVMAGEICFGHHERWDGTGYPFGLAGVNIPLPARIVALADVYDALTSRRAYKEPLSHEDARRMIIEQRGRHFDPGVVEAFLAVESRFHKVSSGATEPTATAVPPPASRPVSEPAKSGGPHRRVEDRSVLRAMLVVLALPLACLVGCAGGPTNPSFAVSAEQAREDLKRMEAQPVRLERPVVVIGGWGDPLGLPPSRLARRLREVTGDQRIVAIGMGGLMSFEGCRHRVIERVQETFPSEDPAVTTQVDVVGFSMGGLVAQDACRAGDEHGDARRLDMARLFAVSSPIRGASAAGLLGLGPLGRGMRTGSEYVEGLAAAVDAAGYEVYYYVRLNDPIVGEANAAPPGQTAWWVPNQWLQLSHAHAYKDPRIVADIARRLRGEEPLTLWPPAPLPGQDEP